MEKNYCFVTYENERISIKKKPYLQCVLCYISPVWSMGRFMAVLWVVMVNWFSLSTYTFPRLGIPIDINTLPPRV